MTTAAFAMLCAEMDAALGLHGLMTRGAIAVPGPHPPISPLAGEMSAQPTEGGDAAYPASSMSAVDGAAPTPLCPAGHLPRKGGHRMEPGSFETIAAPTSKNSLLGRSEGKGSRTVILIGHAGSSIWPHFEAWRSTAPEGGIPDPLDAWSRQVLEKVAEEFGGRAVFPSDRPYLPFQRWAMQAEGLRPSPLGILIHPDYGLWHAYRGAIVIDRPFEIAEPPQRPHACDDCAEKPCLSACPVDAFDGTGFDVTGCRSYLASPAGTGCLARGCAARLACPVGRAFVYGEGEQRFHMAAFSEGTPSGTGSK